MKSLFPDYSYVNLENLDDRAAAVEDPRGFLTSHLKSGVIIDEAQKVPELFSYLQEILDNSIEMGKFILTGFQNYLLIKQITQSLAGRVAVLNLHPFELRELENCDAAVDYTLNRYLFSGMYPSLYDRNIDPVDYYPSYLQTYIERDVRSLKNIGDLNIFRKFLQLCAGRTGQILNLSSIGNEIGVDSKTVKSWISVLEASFIVFLLQPYHRNFNKRVVKHPKLYFYDTGLVSSLLGLSHYSQVENFYMRGSLFENFVISEYKKRVAHLGKSTSIYFWRDNTGNEVDLIIDKGSEFHSVEIKSGKTVNDTFFKGLKTFAKYARLEKEQCHLVYGGDKNMMRKYASVISWKSMERLPI